MNFSNGFVSASSLSVAQLDKRQRANNLMQSSTLSPENNDDKSNERLTLSAKISAANKRKNKKIQANKITSYFAGTGTAMASDCSPSQPAKKRKTSNFTHVTPKRLNHASSSKSAASSDETRGFVFDELPDHIIERILSFLPFMDMMLNAPQVCSHWHDIVNNVEFMKWKKEYHKAKLSPRNPGLISTVFSSCTVESCLPSLILLSVEHCYRPTSTMSELLQRHPKFEAAISLLNERDVFAPVRQEMNPWAIVATITILSETVEDITAIIQILTHHTCDIAIEKVMDSLYFFANALLFFKREYNINSGLHYRLFYALSTYENQHKIDQKDLTLFDTVYMGQQSITKYGNQMNIRLSYEQVRIINHQLNPNELVKVVAFAGTGKTTTLAAYARYRPNLKFLLIVYNKSVCTHAKEVFTRNVTAMTAHSIAYKNVGFRYRGKLGGKLKPYMIREYLSDSTMKMHHLRRTAVVCKMVESFTVSDDREMNEELVPEKIFIPDKADYFYPSSSEKKILLQDAKNVWSAMIDERNMSTKITHDTYLKLYQLSRPKLHGFDCIIIDEAQDCNPAMLDVIMAQECPKILVGDPHQQIYAFRGAQNSLAKVNATHIYYLTQSFRFGPRIAYIASCLLDKLKAEDKKTIVGNINKDFIDGSPIGQLAVIARTNFELFKEAFTLLCQKKKYTRACFIGGLQNCGLNIILDIFHLKYQSSDHEIGDKFISRFKTFQDLVSYANHSEDHELTGKISIVNHFSSNLKDLIYQLKKVAIYPRDKAQIVFTTAHKSKGLEFDTVYLTNDYNFQSEDERNLLYVAATRAKSSLVMCKYMSQLMGSVQEFFEYPMLRKTLPDVTNCIKCSQEVSHDKCLIWCKRTVVYYENPRPVCGALCLACSTARSYYRSFRQIVGHFDNEQIHEALDSEDEFDDPVIWLD